MTLSEYIDSVKSKSIAVIGIGVSNTPLIELLARNGCDVTACDKRGLDALEGEGEKLLGMGVKLRLGETYLDDLHQDIISAHRDSCRSIRILKRQKPAAAS